MKRWEREFQVGLRRCKMSYSKRKGLNCEWDPDLPPAKSLSEQELTQYKEGRNALLLEVADDVDGNILVIE